MGLPNHIYATLKPLIAYHAPWQVARRPDYEALLRELRDAGRGEQFLRIHRDIVRVLKLVFLHWTQPNFRPARRS